MSPDTPRSAGGTRPADAESFRGTSLAASLTVNDLHKSLTWYHEVVGFAVDRRHEREGALWAVSLRAGDVRILISQDDGTRGRDRLKGEGFSLMVSTSEDVDELARGIKERGGALEAEPTDTPWGARVFRLKDPDGFKLAVSSER
jgi:uncharacterized glyoxalase superfamily protein PhnB